MNILTILRECGFTFNKRFGQNFLTDANLLAAIAADAGLEPDDEVIEIGPGAGTLTRALAERARRVTAYEIDRTLAPVLERTLAGVTNVEVRFKDIMEVRDGELPERYKVVANLPYYITTPIVFRFAECPAPPASITVTVQKEVADRFTAAAGSPEYGAVTASLGLGYTVRRTRVIPRSLFTPAPNVDSAVVRMDAAPITEAAAAVRKLIRAAFSMRRKTLCNNLAAAAYPRERVLSALQAMGRPADERGERLSPADYVALYEHLR